MIKFLLLIAMLYSLDASYDEGRKVFNKKCASCHSEFIKTSVLINNFINENKILNLKAPAFNRVVYKILHGRKAVVNSTDMKDDQKKDVREYLEDYLTFPRFGISVSNIRSRKIYPKKKSMKGKVTKKEYDLLTDYIMEYEKHFKPTILKKKVNIDEKKLLEKAKKTNKNILIEAATKKSYGSKYMKKVLSNITIKKEIKKHFIYKKVYIDKHKLPFNLNKACGEIVPSYFILNPKGKLVHVLQTTVNKKEFLKMLKEHNK